MVCPNADQIDLEQIEDPPRQYESKVGPITSLGNPHTRLRYSNRSRNRIGAPAVLQTFGDQRMQRFQ